MLPTGFNNLGIILILLVFYPIFISPPPHLQDYLPAYHSSGVPPLNFWIVFLNGPCRCGTHGSRDIFSLVLYPGVKYLQNFHHRWSYPLGICVCVVSTPVFSLDWHFMVPDSKWASELSVVNITWSDWVDDSSRDRALKFPYFASASISALVNGP